ncbi:MAG: LysR substrate-binding domain-containing protein [Hyphomicrobiales bacterium]
MKLSHLNGLRAFEATLRNGTFTAAADELGVTVAAVGQQIRGLEDYLGITLFDRLPAGAKPTKDALAVASRLTVAFTQIEDVFIELGSGRDPGRLKITMSRFMLDGWMTQRMPDFHNRNPGIEISYHIAEEFVDLLNSDVDLAIRFSPEPTPEYAYDDLHHSCFMPLCTPAFATEHGLSPDTDDLTGVALFQFHDTTNDPAWVGWPELLKRHAIRKSDSGPVQKISGYRVALSGEGLVLCSLTDSFNDLKEGRLVAPLGPSFVTQYTYGHRLVWAAGRNLTNPMRKFRSWVLREQDKFIVQASELLGVDLK